MDTNSKFKREWVTYNEALSALNATSYDGVGFVIPKDLVVIDLDNKSPEDSLAIELLKATSSYDERSKKFKVSCPMLAKHIRENLHYIFVRDSAKGGALRYIYENGCYRLYADDMLKGIIKSYITNFDQTILRMNDVLMKCFSK